MGRLVVFLGIALVLTAGLVAFNWRVDPFGEVWKPGALADARTQRCLLSQELVGVRYYSFKLDVFHHRPVRTLVVGSSRVLKIGSHAGERTFANLGYPGSAPETILKLFGALPAKPVQTVYLGVEAFWFNSRYGIPDTDPSDVKVLEYLLSRNTFEEAFRLTREFHFIIRSPWRTSPLGPRCVIDRFSPNIAWRVDGSRVWAFELDPGRFGFGSVVPSPFTGDLLTWRNGYYADWRGFDRRRLHVLEQVLALARSRHWRVVGFAPPEPAELRHVLDTDARIAPRWHAFLQTMPSVFARYGYPWIALGVTCPASQFPDLFHTDAKCSGRLRHRLDEAARRLP
jgi:hypothetical protein